MRISREDLISKAKSGELKKSDGSKVSALDLIKKFKQETVIPKEPTAIDNGLKDLEIIEATLMFLISTNEE